MELQSMLNFKLYNFTKPQGICSRPISPKDIHHSAHKNFTEESLRQPGLLTLRSDSSDVYYYSTSSIDNDTNPQLAIQCIKTTEIQQYVPESPLVSSRQTVIYQSTLSILAKSSEDEYRDARTTQYESDDENFDCTSSGSEDLEFEKFCEDLRDIKLHYDYNTEELQAIFTDANSSILENNILTKHVKGLLADDNAKNIYYLMRFLFNLYLVLVIINVC